MIVFCSCGCGEPAPIARTTDKRTGAIRGQPQRFVRGHNGRIPEDLRWRYEDRGHATACRIWLGATAGPGWYRGNGYGVRAREGRLVLVHRDVWERAHGAIPDGLEVLHRCDVPACGEIAHLFLGTQRDNVRDSMAKGRHVPPPTLSGRANGNWRHGRREKAA